jgi:hypothetical protein
MDKCKSSLSETAHYRNRKYAGWIVVIWIRIVEGADPSLNLPKRFEKVFLMGFG